MAASPKSASPPQVTVVVCTRDRPSQLEVCLSALSQQAYPSFHVLVVDNGSSLPMAEFCGRHGATCIREPVAGLSRARNAGARVASGDLVAFLDDDAVPEPGWLEALVAGFEDPQVVAVSGRIRYMRAIEGSTAMSDQAAVEAGRGRPDRTFERSMPGWFTLACLGGVGDGGNMAFRRVALLRSPGFDERLGRGRIIEGGEEHLMFMSLLAQGHRIRHVPDAVVRHPFPGTAGLRKRRLIRDRRNAIAYLGFLWSEFPAHRGDIAAHLARAVWRRLVPRRRNESESVGLGNAEALQAAWKGVGCYREARREWCSIAAPDYSALKSAQDVA